jgi:hypothetical protein
MDGNGQVRCTHAARGPLPPFEKGGQVGIWTALSGTEALFFQSLRDTK